MHVLDGNSCQFTLSSSNNQVAIGKHSDDRHSQAEQSLDRTYSFVDGLLDVDLENVTSFGSTVNVGILEIDSSTGELSFDVAEVGIQRLNFLVDLIDGQNLDAVLLNSDKTVIVIVEEQNFIDDFFVGCSV